MAGLSYMQRRSSGRYEFRKRLPKELAGRHAPEHVKAAFPDLVNPKTGCFKGELVRSLDTTDYREAKRRDIAEARKAMDLFEAVQRALNGQTHDDTPNAVAARPYDVDLAAIEAETLAELLAADEAERTHGDDRRRLQTREERAQWPDLVPIHEPWQRGMAEDHFVAYGNELKEMAEEYHGALSKHDPDIVRPETDQAMRRHGVPIDRTSALYHDMGLAVLRAHVRAYDMMLRRQAGDVVETPPAPSKGGRGPKLSEAFERWQQGASAAGARKPGRSGVLDAQPAVRWFIELHGDRRLGEITKGQAREYARAVAQVPNRLPRKLRDLPLPKLLEQNLEGLGYEMRSATTVNKTLGMLAAIISYAMREGLLDCVPGYVNPFDKDIKLRIDKRAEEARDIFEASDLAALFEGRVFSRGERPTAGRGEAAFWLPLIALLSGMRLEEIAGLRLQDLRQDEETGRWVFDIAHEQGVREVKTASSIRKVPVHLELERIGLLRYRQSLIAQGNPLGSSLWPGLTTVQPVGAPQGRPLSAQWSKWFGHYLRNKVGIKDRRKVFHSFRHTFKRMARDAGITEEVHDAMTGHAGSGSVSQRYGRGVSLKPLIEAMDKIVPPPSVAGLGWQD